MKDVQLLPDRKVLVDFDADRDVKLTTGTKAAIRYLNLVGDRYLELLDGPGSTRLLAAGGQIPELRRVVVAYQDQIVMERTLDEALEQVFGKGAGGAAPTGQTTGAAPAPAVEAAAGATAQGAPSPATSGLAAEARGHYDRAVQAQRSGDWAKYGEELKLLGDLLQRMQAPAK